MKVLVTAALAAATSCGVVVPAHAADGKAVYESHCAACHQADGNGAVGLAPPLAGTLGGRLAAPNGRRYISGVVVNGLAGKLESRGVSYNGIMPSWAALTDEDLAAAVNYVLAAFNAGQVPADVAPFAAGDFAQARNPKPAPKELRAWRAESDAAAR